MQMISPSIMPVAPPAAQTPREKASLALIDPRQELLVSIQHNVTTINDPDTASLADFVRGIDAQGYGTAMHAAVTGARAVAPDAEPKLAALDQTIDGAVSVLVAAQANTTPGSARTVDKLFASLDTHLEAVVQASWAVNPFATVI